MMQMNALGVAVPDEVAGVRYEPYQGEPLAIGMPVRKRSDNGKVIPSLEEAILRSGLKDGMTISFHHAFRDGDLTVRPVMEAIRALGIKNLRLAPSSLTDVHDFLISFIEDGTITRLESSGLRGELGRAVSRGVLKEPAVMRSHGDRVRALMTGELHINVAFIAVSCSDEMGNANGSGGKSPCGSLGYAMIDAQYADKSILITDTLVPYPCVPAVIHQTDVDSIAVIEAVGDNTKRGQGATRRTKDPKQLMLAKRCAQIISATSLFKDGFVFQTGGGAVSLATTQFLHEIMERRGVKAGMVLGGGTQAIYDLYNQGLLRSIFTAQSLDAISSEFVNQTPGYTEVSIGQYADPMNGSAYIHSLDFVVLSALEMDLNFNSNILTGSNGELRGALGGGPDTAVGAKITIVAFPLIRGRIPCIVEKVNTICTPGSSVDVVVTDYGCVVNPASPYHQELEERLPKACIELTTLKALSEIAYGLTGKPKPIAFNRDRIVALVEYRGGSLIDVVYQIADEEYRE